MLNEIREIFATRQLGLRKLSSSNSKFPSYTIRESSYYGVAIPCNPELLVSEHSTNAKLFTKTLLVNGDSTIHVLIFGCWDESLRNEFAIMCVDFLDLGKNDFKRKALLKSPIDWWNKWIDLMGNHKNNKTSYNVIAELLALQSIYLFDKSAKWAAQRNSSHDIETDSFSVEVKSTIKKKESTATISSQYQLQSDKPLYLYFCRLEESASGLSINDMKKMLVEAGYPEDTLEMQLQKFGFEMGSITRDIKFRILETRNYTVDDSFPRITESSFKGNKFPDSLLKMVYTLDLNGIPYKEWFNPPNNFIK